MIPQTIPRAMIPQTKSKAEIKKLMGVQPIKYPTVTNLQLEHRRQAKLFMEKCDTCNPKLYYENEEDYKKHLDSHAHKHVLSMTYNRKCEHPDCLMEIWKKLAISKGYSNYKNSQPKQPGEIQIKKPVNELRNVTQRKETTLNWEPSSSAWSAAIAAKNPSVDKFVTSDKQTYLDIQKSVAANRPSVIPPKHPNEVVYQPQPTYSQDFARKNGFNVNHLGYKIDKFGHRVNEPIAVKTSKLSNNQTDDRVIMKRIQQQNKLEIKKALQQERFKKQQDEMERRRTLKLERLQERLKQHQNELERRKALQQERLNKQQNGLEKRRALQ